MRSIFLALVLVTGVTTLKGQQTHSHNLFWLRLAFSDTISQRVKWEGLIQRRTQNSKDNSNIFAAPQFESYWLWLHYNLNSKATVSLSPFGYFESYVLHVKPSDADLPPIKEYRFSARLDYATKGKYINYINRYNLEYRWRDLQNDGNYQPNWRVRYMARFEKPVKGLLPKPVTFILYDEIFLQFGKAVKGNPNIFDQNRLYAGFNYEIIPNVKTTVGYIYGYQERNSGQDFDNINTFWVILHFDNLISQFRRNL